MVNSVGGNTGNNRTVDEEFLDEFDTPEQFDIDTLTDNLQRIAGLTALGNRFLTETSLDTARTNVAMARLEALGMEAQLDINYATNVANLEADLANLQGRATFLLASKTQEISTLIAQFREKSLQLFIQIMEQRTNNAWNRVKTLANGFKF